MHSLSCEVTNVHWVHWNGKIVVVISLLAAAKISLCFGRRGCRYDGLPVSVTMLFFYCIDILMIWYVERFVMFSDSMSVLQAIESQESKNPLVNRVLQTCQEIISNGKFITFYWIPSHRDITGNEDADRDAKDALSKAQPGHFELPCIDVFIKIQPFVSSLWKKRWDKEVGNKLHAIMPQIDDKYYSGCINRKDNVIINRLRIGHTRLTHSFRMENRPHQPLCDQCEGDHELTVKHILIECNFLKIIRRRHYDVTI